MKHDGTIPYAFTTLITGIPSITVQIFGRCSWGTAPTGPESQNRKNIHEGSTTVREQGFRLLFQTGLPIRQNRRRRLTPDAPLRPVPRHCQR